MTIQRALKEGLVVEVETDLYLTENGREIKYDRSYRKPRSRRYSEMWVDEAGNVFKNFFDAYYKCNAYIWRDKYVNM